MPAREAAAAEALRRGERVPALPHRRQVREVFVDVEEGRAGHVPGEVELPTPLRRAELPTAVDELDAHLLTITLGARSGSPGVAGRPQGE